MVLKKITRIPHYFEIWGDFYKENSPVTNVLSIIDILSHS